MGRHAGFDDLVVGAPARRGRRLLGWLVGLLVVALAAAAGVVVAGPDRVRDLARRLPLADRVVAAGGCTDPVVVRVVAAPSAAPTVGRMLGPLTTPSESTGCVRAAVETQDPAETVSGADVLPLDRAPDLWVPDAAYWLARVPRWPATKVGTLGSSPLVLATSRSVVTRAGWSGAAPSWAAALTSGRPLAVPSPAEHAESLVALASMWQALGKGKEADQALVGTELVAARTADLDVGEALQLAQTDTEQAPLVPTTEQSVFALNRAVPGSALTAVYPDGGSPALDYPVLRLRLPAGAVAVPPSRAAAVDRVVARLASPEARSVAAADGFRQSAQAGPKAAGVSAGPVTVLPSPDAGVLRDVLGRLAALAKPSRMLALVDVSRSMVAQLPDGTTRIQLAAAAAAQGVQLLPDQASVGIWVFSSGLDGPDGYQVLADPDPLGGVTADGTTRRDQVLKQIGTVGDRLRSGGTPLYDTVLAGVRYLHDNYDPGSVNSVVVFTDGANQNSRGITLTRLLRTLQDEADPARPVPVFTIGIGPAVDTAELKQIAEATGGRSYEVDSPARIRAALLDGLSARRPVGSTG